MKARIIFLAVFFLAFTRVSYAHFGTLIPSRSIIEQASNPQVDIMLAFTHPFSQAYMDLIRPFEFAVIEGEEKKILTKSLIPITISGHKAWRISYVPKRPGDHIFYMIPQPYWEPNEQIYIQHLTKVIVNFFGLEDSWNKRIGLEAEIVPLTRPYGLWKGNSFCARVERNGKAQANIPVEVEYFNEDKRIKAPSPLFETQILTTNANGEFCYSMPFEGWWGFSALFEKPKTIEKDGKRYDLELGAVMWVRVGE